MRRAAAAWVLAAAGAVPGPALAQFADGWSLSGSNTARLERYGASGDPAAGPFPHLGTTGFDEFIVTGVRAPSPWSLQRFFVSGLLNDSPYRSRDDGLVPERVGFTAQSGESRIAWRVEAGDFFAFTSLRTMQRSLKGASVELQPPPMAGWRHSILAFAGAGQHSWRHLQWSDDNAAAASWLVDTDRFGRWNATYVRSRRGPGFLSASAGERTQSVASLAGETSLDAGPWKLRAEGELARIDGDHDGLLTGVPGRDVEDTGLFAQLSGLAGDFHWRLRGERYGRDYQPFGAITPPDRRSVEAHAGWNLPWGLSVRGRLQDYRDAWEGENPLDTRVVGVNVSGGYAPWSVSGLFDAFVQDAERRDGTEDARFSQASLNLSRTFGRWIGQLAASRLDRDDRIDDARSFTTTQVQVGAAVPVGLGPMTGSITPGVLHRRVTGAGATRDWQPTLALTLAGGPHRFNASVGRLEQDPRDATIARVATVNAAVDYRYRWGSHELGLDAVWFDRDPSGSPDTQAYRIGASWTWYFEKPAAARVAAASTSRPVLPPVATSLPRSVALLARIAPGHDLAATRRALAASGFGDGIADARSVAYEARLVEDVEQRQRLVVAHYGGIVDRVALVVALDGEPDPARVYERVRRVMLDAYGAPAMTFDEGAATASFARDVAAGRLVRITEWATPSGVLRLGIPRRLDGAARIEIHHARAFASPRDPGWGLE